MNQHHVMPVPYLSLAPNSGNTGIHDRKLFKHLVIARPATAEAIQQCTPSTAVMPVLDTGIQTHAASRNIWITGSSPVMTYDTWGWIASSHSRRPSASLRSQ